MSEQATGVEHILPGTARAQALLLNLDDLAAEIDAGECSLTACKQALKQGNERIYQSYLDGVPAGALVAQQSQLTDVVLTRIWQHGFSDAQRQQMDLLAVGGYGREELHPYSDVDVAILTSTSPSASDAEALEKFITFLWDLGLDIGHSVRTVAECSDEARADLTVITNLLESRLLSGSGDLFSQMQEAISTAHMWPAEAFYEAKMEEQDNRRARFHDNAYRLEPNIKESNGGLRDIQTLCWICQRQFGTRGYSDLETQGLLTSAEYDTLLEGLTLLWRLRFLLHRQAGRREDRLLFDHQREIAHAWGFTDDTGNQSIEQLMQLFYRNAMQLQRLNEIILQGIGGIISGVTAATPPVAINSRFQVRNGFLEVQHDQVFVNYPPALLEVFLIFGDTEEARKFRSNTVRLIRSHLDLIDRNFRDDMIVRGLFLDIFRRPEKLTRKIRLMNRYGVLAAYLPEFSLIVGRMQYDLFHVYTVDEHTTRVIRNLRRFALPEFADEFPHCTSVMERIDKPELLYLIGLFHDIAKGRGGDHSELGAEDAQHFGETHSLGPADTGLIAWVVRMHLVMSVTAQRKDISDPDIIHEFATLVSSRKHLDHLYLLTVADIRATNPDLWNSFKQNLLRDLYESTRRHLDRGLDNPMDAQAVVAQKKQEADAILSHDELDGEAIATLWEQLGDHYFLHYRTEEIVRHTLAIMEHEDHSSPLVTLRTARRRGSTEVFVYTRDHDNLFALICGALARLNLDIQSANFHTTSDGHVLDTLYVLDADGKIIREATRLDRIKQAVLEALREPDDAKTTFGHTPRQLKHFDRVPTVEFDNERNKDLTSIWIVANDQPGILSLIGNSFREHSIKVHSARIATHGERVEDMFFVTDAENRQVTDSQQQQALRESLQNQL